MRTDNSDVNRTTTKTEQRENTLCEIIFYILHAALPYIIIETCLYHILLSDILLLTFSDYVCRGRGCCQLTYRCNFCYKRCYVRDYVRFDIYIYSYLLVPCGCCCLRTDECISENAMIARILALFKNHILHYFLHAFLSRRSRQPDFKSWCACVISVGYV